MRINSYLKSLRDPAMKDSLGSLVSLVPPPTDMTHKKYMGGGKSRERQLKTE